MGETYKRIPFYLHDIGEPELARIAEVFKGPILTTGAYVEEFERKFAAYLGVKHAIACSSCTGAAHISFAALGIGPGDEVITTPLTFIATATAIVQAGAIPVFADVEPDTGNIAPEAVERAITPRTRAINPVHLYGQMCDMNALRGIADRHSLRIVEDSAHCVEGRRDGHGPGQRSDTACFSFFATKNLACGEGGAVVTNDDALAAQLRLLRLHGMTKTSADREREGYQHWDMVSMGWKYNMDNIHAAILLPQLEGLEKRWQRRQHLCDLYFQHLKDIPGLSWPRRETADGRHGNHLFTIHVPPASRDTILTALTGRGVGTTINYRAIHLLSYFRDTYGYAPGDFPNAERIGNSTITLPLYCRLEDGDVALIASHLREIMTTLRENQRTDDGL